MKSSTQASRLLHGAFVLSAAAIISKLMGTLQKIPLQNLGGDAVFGIYNTVYPLYTVLVTVAMLGLPAAVSKFVAETATGRGEMAARRILLRSVVITGSSGILLGIATSLGAPLIAEWVGNSHIVTPLRIAAWGLAFVPIMSAFRGYFQGLHNMVPTAVSQIVEQSVRVALMIVLLLYLTSRAAEAETIAAGAMLGSAGGGVAGLLIMLLYWRRHRIRNMNKSMINDITLQDVKPGRLLSYGIPVMLGALAVPLIGLVDVFTVPRLLSWGGGERDAMVQFGVYNRGLPLVQLVTMIATSLSVVFIPALAEANYRRDSKLIELRCQLSLRWFWLLGLAASAGLAVLAGPINVALYGNAAGTSTMMWLAFTAVGGTLSIISAALLQGLGYVRAPALHLLAAALLKAALNLLLVPQQGITGAAIAGVAAHLFAAALNVLLLRRKAHLRLRFADVWAKPALLIAGLALAAAAASWGAGAVFAAAGLAGGRTASLAQSVVGVSAGCAVFAVGVVALRMLSESELQGLPGIGPPLAKLMRKLHLFQ